MKQTKYVDLNNIIHKNKEEHREYLHFFDSDYFSVYNTQITHLEAKEKNSKCYYIYKYYLNFFQSLVYQIDVKITQKNDDGKNVEITTEIKKLILYHNNKKLYSIAPGSKMPITEDNPFYSYGYDTNAIVVVFDCDLNLFCKPIEFEITLQRKDVKGLSKFIRDYTFNYDNGESITIISKKKEPALNIMCDKYRNCVYLPDKYNSEKGNNFYFIKLHWDANYYRSKEFRDEIIDIEFIAMDNSGTSKLFSGQITIDMYDSCTTIFDKKYKDIESVIIDKSFCEIKDAFEDPIYKATIIRINSDCDMINIIFHENRIMELLD